MARLYVKNIGPLKEVDIELNRINVFIGPQSIGKSTAAKLISFCHWLEKDCVLHQDTDHIDGLFIEKNLVKYHNLNGYFTDESELRYEGHAIRFKVSAKQTKAEKTAEFADAELSKNAYIPSERNILSIPGIFSVRMPDNYLLDFVDDWQEIRAKYSHEESLDILNLGGSYYFSEQSGSDMVHLQDGPDIRFSQASSGLQSVVPLCVCIDYLTRWIYSHEENRSADDRRRYRDMMVEKLGKSLMREIGEEGILMACKKFGNASYEELKKEIEDIYEECGDDDEKILALPEEWKNFIITFAQTYQLHSKLVHPVASHLVVEEPEENLFPETQVELIYYMLSKLDLRDRDDSLVLTTHSPYVLYAVNNCMLAHLASAEDAEAVEAVVGIPRGAWLDPKAVSVWEIRDGRIPEGKTIQDGRGLVRDNYFDRVMHNVMADFSNLLNFIG